MGKTLSEIAQPLKEANKKVQLIYAFNGKRLLDHLKNSHGFWRQERGA